MQQTFRAPSISLGEFSAIPNHEIKDTVQVLRAGTFNHPEYGQFEIKASDIETMIKNFSDKVRGVDLAIDYSHEADKEAAGWIQDLYLQEGQDGKAELWARVKWTQTGKDSLVDRKYRYLSADFAFSYKNNETSQEFGPTLFGAGLTNRPVIKNMSPVIELAEYTKPKGADQMDELQKLKAENEMLKAEIEKLKSGSKPEVDVEMEDLKKKLGAYEAEKQASDAAKLAAETKLAEMVKTDEFNKLMTEGKACEAQRKFYLSGDAVEFAKAAQPLKLDTVGGKVETPAEDKSNPEAKILSEANALIKTNAKLTLGEAISKVMKDKPELAKLYRSKMKGE